MNKLTTILSTFTITAIVGLLLAGCSSTVTPPAVGPSSNVRVTSATTTSITVSWTRGSGDTSVDTIFVTGGSQLIASVYAASGSSSGVVTGLTTDVVYSIVIGSSSGRTTAITYTIGAVAAGTMTFSANGTTYTIPAHALIINDSVMTIQGASQPAPDTVGLLITLFKISSAGTYSPSTPPPGPRFSMNFGSNAFGGTSIVYSATTAGTVTITGISSTSIQATFSAPVYCPVPPATVGTVTITNGVVNAPIIN